VLLSAYPAGAKCFFLPAGEAPCSGSFHHQKNSYLRDIPLWGEIFIFGTTYKLFERKTEERESCILLYGEIL
jgi:hypothetical protein